MPLRYQEWNDALAEHFFNLGHAEAAVYLDVEPHSLVAAARILGLSLDESAAEDAFLSAFRESLGTMETGVFAPHGAWLRQWDGASYPPIVACLALASMAAEAMGRDDDLSSSNYYSPLMRLLGLDPDDNDARKAIQRSYRDHVLAFWDALGSWLEEHDGALGLATFSVAGGGDNRRHIAPALGQALVRDADRRKLPRFFSYFKLAPGQEIDPDRMLDLLDRWVPSSPMSKVVKRRWATSTDLNFALAEVASSELLAWDGVIPGAEVDGVADLRLAVHRPRRGPMRIGILVQGIIDVPKEVIVGGRVHEGEWTQVANGWLCLSLADVDLLGQDIELEGSRTCRRAQSVATFRLDGSIWIETGGMEAGEPHLVIADDRLDRVATLIEVTAQPGWRRIDSGGWSAFLGVTMPAPPDAAELPPTLRPLGSVGRRSLTPIGGLKLPGRPPRWHADAPPTLSIDGIGGEYEVVLQGPGQDELSLGHYVGQAQAQIPSGLASGTYVATAPGAAATIRLRTSTDEAATHIADPVPELNRSDQSSLGVLWAIPGPSKPALLPVGSLRRQTPLEMPTTVVWDPPPTRSSTTDAAMELAERVRKQARSRKRPTCLEDGPCLQAIAEGIRRGRAANPPCVYCGARPNERERYSEHLEWILASDRPSATAGPEDAALTPLIVDAILHLRSGAVPNLQRWLGRLGLDGIRRAALIRDLEAYGFIDIGRPTSDGHRWRAAPATLLPSPDRPKTWRLTGLATRDLRDALTQMGVQVEEDEAGAASPTPGFPIWTVHGLSHEEASEASELLATDGLALEVAAPDALRRCAATIKPVASAVQALESKPLGSSDRGEFYSAAAARFLPPDAISADGLYRVEVGFKRQYWWVSAGVRRKLPNGDAGKVLAGAAEGRPTMAYIGGAIVLPLGMRLPGLYDRIATLAADSPPTRQGSTFTYPGVPQELANMLYTGIARASA